MLDAARSAAQGPREGPRGEQVRVPEEAEEEEGVAPARVEHHQDNPQLGHAQHEREGSEGHAGIHI